MDVKYAERKLCSNTDNIDSFDKSVGLKPAHGFVLKFPKPLVKKKSVPKPQSRKREEKTEMEIKHTATSNSQTLKGAKNLLKVNNVTSEPTHWDIQREHTKQDCNLPEQPEKYSNLNKIKKEYTEEEHHAQEYNNILEHTERNHTESNTTTINQYVKVKNKMVEQLNSSKTIVKVKEEATSDSDTLNTHENLPNDNFFDDNLTVKDEFSENHLLAEQSCVKVNEIPKNNDRANRRVDGVLKNHENVDGISKSLVIKYFTSFDQYSLSKCTVCFKTFLGSDACNEHMKKHATQETPPVETKPFGGIVLKSGNPLSNKCTTVKVKRIQSKEIAKEDYEGILNKYLDTLKSRNENATANNSASVQNNSSTENDENNLLTELPIKRMKNKLPKKRVYSKPLTMSIIFKSCDDNCTNDEHCTQTKKCRRRRRSKDDIDSRYECTLCDYKCRYKKGMDTHMLTHSKVKKFSCHLCEYKCIQRSHLDQHIRTHTRTKPYSCNYCEYVCVQRSHLDQHIRTHTGEKPFTCNFCTYTCTQRGHLDQHMRIHTGTKPYSCVHCDYICVQRAHLDNHIMKTHRKVRKFSCPYCKYKTIERSLFVKHMKAHTGMP